MAVFGLVGKSLSHSFSKGYFKRKFKNLDLPHSYENFEISSADQFKTLIDKNPNLKGLNITIPYKTEIIPFLDEVSTEAAAIGAVNTVQFKNGKTIGDNTDWLGFRDSIKPFLAHDMEKALVLGTGGSSKAVAYALKPLGIEVLYASTNPHGPSEFSYDILNDRAMDMFKLIINTTPLGMYPNTDAAPPLPYHAISAQHLLYDLIYNPSETEFLKKGKAQGAIIVNGLSMLNIQAERSWEIWNS